ncbi:cell division protein, partial [Micrococcus sp. ACRRV]|nr:cell division protein [Micrococcus sp. ACRRV]
CRRWAIARTPTDSATSAAGVLAMAQRLHDEYVAEGEQRRDRIIADAEAEATTVVRQAEETRTRTLSDLESRRKGLEADVERLRAFETDYRSRLTAYIEGQLREITAQERLEPAKGTV